MTENLLTVTIAKRDGTVLFVGFIPDDDVRITHEPNKPSTATVRMPLRDAMATLADARASETGGGRFF